MKDVRCPGFWKTADYIRRNYRWVEPVLGTKYLLRITRDLIEHWKYATFHKGIVYVRAHWYEHIDEYIKEQEEMLNATENYVRAVEENEFLRDQFA